MVNFGGFPAWKICVVSLPTYVFFLQADNPTNQRPGLMLSTHVTSLKGGGTGMHLDGVMLLLSDRSAGLLK